MEKLCEECKPKYCEDCPDCPYWQHEQAIRKEEEIERRYDARNELPLFGNMP